MNRRHILAAASGVAVPVLLLAKGPPAFAQNTTTASDMTLSAAQHKMQTLQIGSLALQTSQLALQRAKNARVREFAGFERNEQMTIAQVLTDTQAPEPMTLDQTSAGILQALSSASDSQFDTTYVTQQIQGHTQLLQVQQAFLQGQSSMASDDVHIAMLARTTIQMHLTMLNDLQSALQG
jgi:putative membrane protein